jgi:hypothetical protein
MHTFAQKLIRLISYISAAFIALAFLSANATVVTATSGLTTTYKENFNGGSSFSDGWYDALLTNDDYLWLTVLNPVSSFTFSSSRPLSSLSLSFWYSVPGDNNGQVEFANSGIVSLGDVPGTALQFLLNNPGASSSGLGGAFDRAFSGSVSNLEAGTYTVTLSTAGHLLNGLKVDDLTITTTAVPEPGSIAVIGIGLLAAVRVRRLTKKKYESRS